MVITHNIKKDQPGKVANPARGQLNRLMKISLSPFASENLVSRDGFGSPLYSTLIPLYSTIIPLYGTLRPPKAVNVHKAPMWKLRCHSLDILVSFFLLLLKLLSHISLIFPYVDISFS